MTAKLHELLKKFALEGEPVSCERYGFGHINETYLTVTDTGRRYIFQRINHHVFQDVPGLMNNIYLVTTHLKERTENPNGVMTVVPTLDGQIFLKDEGNFWRVYDFVEGSVALQLPRNEQDFYESAIAFGDFQGKLADFPVEKLVETIPNFHNTVDRYRIFKEVLAKDPMGRAKEVQEEIDFVLSHEEEMGTLQRMRDSGELPSRVTHNDTKLNNVLLDAQTYKPLCVIDLDTVMPGLSLYDFGDSIRFGAATAAEDEKDLSKMEMSLDLFRTYTRGFVTACKTLTGKELEMLPMGAKTMTMECGVRFLTDYLDGDHYFAVHREGHNLDRARTQFKLVRDMEKKWDDMKKIVAEERK